MLAKMDYNELLYLHLIERSEFQRLSMKQVAAMERKEEEEEEEEVCK
jgi:hypothetical protein